jgi:hypothetical protein
MDFFLIFDCTGKSRSISVTVPVLSKELCFAILFPPVTVARNLACERRAGDRRGWRWEWDPCGSGGAGPGGRGIGGQEKPALRVTAASPSHGKAAVIRRDEPRETAAVFRAVDASSCSWHKAGARRRSARSRRALASRERPAASGPAKPRLSGLGSLDSLPSSRCQQSTSMLPAFKRSSSPSPHWLDIADEA